MDEDLEKEKELIKRAQNDPQAFSELYDQNYSKIFGYVLKRVADVEIAQDVTSETFLKSLKNIKRFKWKNISFSCWLYRIASNVKPMLIVLNQNVAQQKQSVQNV